MRIFLRHQQPRVAPKLADIVPLIAIGSPARSRQRLAMADFRFRINVEAAVRAKQEIIVEGKDRGQTGCLDRWSDRRRQSLGPGVDMDDGPVMREARKELGKFSRG